MGDDRRYQVPARKAVAMISGGLDSTLAARIMLEQGVELTGLYLSAPWGCCDKGRATKVAAALGIGFRVVKMTQEYLGVIRSPRYGYGSSMNPCIDCRIYMFKKAKEVMAEVGGSFLVTGEVLGQRPMSQMRGTLALIEDQSGLSRLVVRPLSAKLLPATLPEEQRVIDRERMFALSGRSRKGQMELAVRFRIGDYPNPAGGCLLTDRQFGRRVKDLFERQADIDLEEMELLRVGRHFRVSESAKLIVGRNEQENATLGQYLAPGRALFEPDDFPGPSVLLVGPRSPFPGGQSGAGPPDGANQRLALGIIRHYAKTEKLPQGPRVRIRVGVPRGNGSAPPEQILALDGGIEAAELERMRIG